MRKLLCAVLAAVALSAGCSEVPRIEIVNNSGAPITVLRGPGGDGSRRAPISIVAGKSGSIHLGEMPAPQLLIIVSERCTYVYEPPGVDRGYFEWAKGAQGYGQWTVQLERDRRLWLLPTHHAEPIPAQSLPPDIEKRYGYPVAPTFTRCVAEAGAR